MKNTDKILSKEFKNNRILLLSFESRKYREYIEHLIKYSINKFKKTCYISLNYPYENILSNLDTNKEKIFFIDCVTATVKRPKPTKGVVFVSSPHALTEISIALEKTMEKEKMDFVLFDSISAILIYESPLLVMKFIHRLILMLRKENIYATFLIMKEDIKTELMKDLAMFVDKIVEL